MIRLLSLLLLPLAVAACSTRVAEIEIQSEEDKTLYAIGLSVARNLDTFALDADDLARVEAGLRDGVLGKEPKVKVEEYGQKILELRQERVTAAAEVEKKASTEFLAKAAKEEGAVQTESGLVFRTLEEGEGESPAATDTVTVHYHGTLRDGTVFDSSVDRDKPATFALNRVIPCWTEGVQKMKAGGKAKLVCPAAIAYGDRGAPPVIKPGATLVFEVELIEIAKADAPKAEAPKAAPEGE